MKVEIEDVSSCKKTLKIEIPPEDVNAELEKVYEEIRTTALIPGFRKGKVPRRILKMRFNEYAKNDVIEKLVPPAFQKAAEDANMEILRPLDAADMSPPIDELSVKENEPLIFEVTIDVKPEVVIPDLTELEVEKGDINVAKEEVDALLERLRDERANFVPVEDRPAQEGDYVNLSILATSDGEIMEDQKEQVLEVGKSTQIPELVQNLIGMQPKDEKDFSISFPDDYPVKNLAGKEVNFHVSLHKIMEKHLPTLNDDFAKDLGEEDLQHLNASIWNRLVEMGRRTQRTKQESDLLDQLLEKSQFEVPDFLVEEQTEALIRSYKQQNQAAETELNEEELSEYRSAAVNMIKRAWIFDGIAKREEINVTDEELENQVKIIAEMQDKDPQKYMRLLEAANRIDGIRMAIWEKKILDLLIEKASPKRSLIV